MPNPKMPTHHGAIAALQLVVTNPDGSVLFDQEVALTSGEFTVPSMPRMHLFVSAKTTHWLRRKVVVAHGASDLATLSLLNGDCDDDNEVSIGDFSLLSAAFNSAPGDPTWNPMADLNGDEGVDIGDFAILSSNFGRIGDD